MKENKTALLDIEKGAFAYRLKQSRVSNELIAKAVGIKSNFKPTVIDATAGLGKDGLILAYLGCKVLLIERNEEIFHSLENLLAPIFQAAQFSTKISLQLIRADSIVYLSQLSRDDSPDVIYLDPMFPERKKSALVKKDIRLLQTIVGKDEDADTLLAVALNHAKKRVVVKRPRLAPTLGNKTPSFSLTGKKQRFDIYLINSL